ncbi:MAG: hypothetical protein KGZ51_04795 [Erysipelothrix sp.]|nr:hypothetical protein [Erysipelothrix sp.]
MKNWKLLYGVLFGLVLSSCAPIVDEPCEDVEECPTCEVCEVCEVCPVNPFPEGLVLPQIYIQGKLFWTNSDLESLNDNVIEPIIEYYEEEGHTVVSITITTDDLSAASINTIIVEVMISDNDGNQDPLYMGVLIEKVDGEFPLWEQESIGP